jgi:hypothetical protein
MTIQIIGAGLGRTGTSSLKVALEQLGYNKNPPDVYCIWRVLVGQLTRNYTPLG